MTILKAKFYNLDNYRDAGQVKKEIKALLASEPHVLGLCECVGNVIPGLDGWKLIRDTSRPGRENLAAYVRKNVPYAEVRWWDLEETWTKTAEGATGQHWPRSWLEFRLGEGKGVQTIIGHQPPKGTDNVKASQQEGIDLLVRRMAPWKRDDWEEKSEEEQANNLACPRLALADYNRKAGEDGPGPSQLASKIDGWTAGSQIDLGVWRGEEASLQDWWYDDSPAGCQLQSDHSDAFACTLRCEERWIAS